MAKNNVIQDYEYVNINDLKPGDIFCTQEENRRITCFMKIDRLHSIDADKRILNVNALNLNDGRLVSISSRALLMKPNYSEINIKFC